MSFMIEDGVLKKYIYEDQEETVVIPEGVRVIDIHAFVDCRKLKHVSIPNTGSVAMMCPNRSNWFLTPLRKYGIRSGMIMRTASWMSLNMSITILRGTDTVSDAEEDLK